MIPAINQTEITLEIVGATGRFASALEHGTDITGSPTRRNQTLSGIRCCRRRLDHLDNFIDVSKRYCKALEHVSTLSCFSQQEQCASRHHLAAMADKGLDDLF